MSALKPAIDDEPIVPVDGPWRISSPFSLSRRNPADPSIVRPHKGVDLACAPGTHVLAYRRGVVELVWPNNKTAGNFCVLRHDDNTRSRYLDMGSFDAAVKVGARVTRGQRIGTVGNPVGVSTGFHLHFEVREPGANGTGEAVDPVVVVPGLHVHAA